MATAEERLLETVTAGNLKSRVTLMDPVETIDDYGNRKKLWVPGATVWAYIENHTSQVYETAGEMHIIRKSIIGIRYRKGITPSTRYASNDRIYKPTGAPIDACGRHKCIYVECVEELKNDGEA